MTLLHDDNEVYLGKLVEMNWKLNHLKCLKTEIYLEAEVKIMH